MKYMRTIDKIKYLLDRSNHCLSIITLIISFISTHYAAAHNAQYAATIANPIAV